MSARRWAEAVRSGMTFIAACLLVVGASFLTASAAPESAAKVEDLNQKFPAVATVAQLKTQKPKAAPTEVKPESAAPRAVLRAQPRLAAEAAKSLAYSQGSGVVLDAARTTHEVTGSRLTLIGVTWEPITEARVKAGTPNTPVMQAIRWDDVQGSVIGPGVLLARFGQVQFQHLAPGVHTYALSVGTSTQDQFLYFRANGAWLHDFGGWGSAPFEARVLLEVDGSAQDSLTVDLYHTVPTKLASTTQIFLHAQLAQVD